MSYRAVRILGEVDIVAAEDTRVTRKLLNHFNITTRMMSYHRHSSEARDEQILSLLQGGKRVALVSDAGMPGISDPGQRLISVCVKNNILVQPIPGPSSLTTALAVSGFNTDRFRFLGFISRGRKDRRAVIQESLLGDETCAAFEAPHRVAATLADFASLAPEHPLLLARELTKKFEELLRGTAEELAVQVAARDLRGEIVLVWPGKGLEVVNEDRAEIALRTAIQYRKNGMSARDAATRAATESGFPRRAIYQALIGQQS